MTVVPLPHPATFDDFWPNYPKRLTPRGTMVRLGRVKAQEEFNRAVKRGVPVRFLIAAAQWYGATQSPEYIMDCYRWLRDRFYEDYEPEEEPEVDVERMVLRAVEEETKEARDLAKRKEADAFRAELNSDPERRDAYFNQIGTPLKWPEFKQRWGAEND